MDDSAKTQRQQRMIASQDAAWLSDGMKAAFTSGDALDPIISARYLSERFSNFTNTQEIGAYTVWNAYVDLGDGGDLGPLKGVKLRLNVDNIFDEDYLGTINTTINTPATFRPGPDRTVQATITGSF